MRAHSLIASSEPASAVGDEERAALLIAYRAEQDRIVEQRLPLTIGI